MEICIWNRWRHQLIACQYWHIVWEWWLFLAWPQIPWMVSLFDYIIMVFALNIRNWLYIICCAILYIVIDCKCNETVMHGYGMCRKRSSRLGGNFLCAVDDDSNCTDVVQEPGSGIYVSVEACKNINLG